MYVTNEFYINERSSKLDKHIRWVKLYINKRSSKLNKYAEFATCYGGLNRAINVILKNTGDTEANSKWLKVVEFA